MNLSAMIFAPGEMAASNHLYIVHRGVALYGGRVLCAGRVWGEDMILMTPHLQTSYCARAINYLEVYMIRRDELLSIAAHFPFSSHKIRQHAIRLAVRREFIRQAPPVLLRTPPVSQAASIAIRSGWDVLLVAGQAQERGLDVPQQPEEPEHDCAHASRDVEL